MNILMVSDDFLPAATGVGSHLKVVAPLLVERGHNVSILTSRRDGEPEFEMHEGVKVFRAKSIKTFGFYQAMPSKALINKILDDEKIELVHHHYLSVMLSRVFREAETRQLPQIYTYHMTVDHLTQPLMMRPLRPLLSRLILHYCNKFGRIMVPSQALTDQVIAGGVTVPTFFVSNPVIFNGDEAPVKPPGLENPFVVFFAGRLNPEKNVPFLLKGFFEFITQSGRDAELRIAGMGSSRADYERECERLKISDKVSFLGFLNHEQIAEQYAQCDVFVLPSLVETQGLVAMEAMRFSKPVIVADTVVSAKELVDPEVNGYIVRANDISQMAARLNGLAQDPELCVKLGAAGKERAAAYSQGAIVSEIERHYNQLSIEL